MNKKLINRLKKIEVFSLYIVAFTLPTLENIKNTSIYLIILCALGWRFFQKPFLLRKPDIAELLLVSMLCITITSTLINYPYPHNFNSIGDSFMFIFLFWVMYKKDFNDEQIKKMVFFLIVGIIIGLIWGFFVWKNNHYFSFMFPSIKGVNRSANFIGVSLILMIGIYFDDNKFDLKVQLISSFCIFLSTIGIFLMGSRGCLLGFIVAMVIITIKFIKNKKFLVTFAFYCVLLFLTLFIILNFFKKSNITRRLKHITNGMEYILNKDFNIINYNKSDSERFLMWKLSFVQATKGNSIFFGIGPRNFKSINLKKIPSYKKIFDKDLNKYIKVHKKHAHAHNVFLTKWVEEGILGLTVFVLFLIYILKTLIIYKSDYKHINWKWVACLGAFSISIIGGFFNSSFYKEMGLLTMMLMGIYLGNNANNSSNTQSI